MKRTFLKISAVALLCAAAVSIIMSTKSPKLVALTFDDGPHREFTPQVVEALNQRGAKGTFFMVGSWVGQKEELVRQMADDGHQIANHSWEHANFLRKPLLQMMRCVRNILVQTSSSRGLLPFSALKKEVPSVSTLLRSTPKLNMLQSKKQQNKKQQSNILHAPSPRKSSFC